MTRVEVVEWGAMRAAICAIRETVFITEQHVPSELEWDGLDDACTQLLAFSDSRAVGTARMTAAGKIGRMAVLKAWRRQGVGSQLLTTMIAVARDAELARVVLDAQVYAIPFYQAFGFEIASGTFMDAGIEHRRMSLELP